MKDPVCGMQVDRRRLPGRASSRGRPTIFCSKGCKTKFDANPAQYVTPPPAATKADPAPDAAEYTCPMHPEVRQAGPGACPICGMALEPVDATLEEDTSELDDMTRRFRWSLAVTLPILAVMVSEFLPGQPLQHLLPPAAMTLGAVPAGHARGAVGAGRSSCRAGPRS